MQLTREPLTPIKAVVLVFCLIVIGVAGWSIYSQFVGGSAGRIVRPVAGAPDRTGGRAGLLEEYDLTGLTIDPDKLLHGGPWKDGIPSLTTEVALTQEARDLRDPDLPGVKLPQELDAKRADYLLNEDRIVSVTLNGVTKGYPIKVLNWHEIVNDLVGGIPIAVVYCPLCDSVSVVDRRVGDDTLEFGVSGLLYNSNVVMYDRTHLALWSQERMGAISGPSVGQSFTHLWTWKIVPAKSWRAAHPDAMVLTYATGHKRPYARGAYHHYFTHDDLKFPVDHADDRLPKKAPVIGVAVGDVARAYPLSVVHAAPDGVLRDKLVEGEGDGTVVLRSTDDGKGVAIESIPEGGRVIHTFWFAWSAFHKDTEIFEPAK